MVEAVRRGLSLRDTAAKFGVSHVTVLRWTRRAGDARLARVDWTDRAAGARGGRNRTPAAMESQVIELRRELRERSVLGEYGAKAIRAELVARGLMSPPSLRTIGRILERGGALDGARRVPRPAPPRGWYLPDLAERRAEADSLDVVEDLKIQGGPLIDVLTCVSLHGGLPAAWPMESVPATAVVERLIEHWREVGLPDYAQFDNDRRFQGPARWADSVGRVSRLCLSLGVAVVFAPPREHGLQADIERFNLLWQQKAWRRFHHTDLADLVARSGRYIAALRARRAVRIEVAPARRPFPQGWRLDLPSGTHLTFNFLAPPR